MSAVRRLMRRGVLVAGLLVSACACGAEGSGADGEGVASAPSSAGGSSRPPAPEQSGARGLTISLGDGTTVTATVRDTAAARALVAQLPVTVEMRDHGGVEKTGPLPAPLPVDDEPSGADPDPGDLGYYAPGNDLVLYYGDQSFYDGIVILGRLDDDAAARIARIPGGTTARVEPAG